jgi:hypothetical protein
MGLGVRATTRWRPTKEEDEMMSEYEVEVPEIWYQKYKVQAESAATALQEISAGGGEAVDNALEYSSVYEDGRFRVTCPDGTVLSGLSEELAPE